MPKKKLNQKRNENASSSEDEENTSTEVIL